ncbi:hypothetical protein QBZ16_004806 [Prototheca wickerhamii]|uniref:START domain-containing protein n=1 Tax=Prototheca wickerhamii TaxID=3111 RepID=A0AAD9IJF2_PROWI|nr:hypothetical protein QBZ16_004806 [Prototheca wickerhamii]
MDFFGFRAVGNIDGHPLLSECCQVVVTSAAVVGVLLVVGPQCLPQPVPTSMLGQLAVRYRLMASSTQAMEQVAAAEADEPTERFGDDVPLRDFIGKLAPVEAAPRTPPPSLESHLLRLDDVDMDDADDAPAPVALRSALRHAGTATRKTVRYAPEQESAAPARALEVAPLASLSAARGSTKAEADDAGVKSPRSPMRRARSVPTLLSRGADAWRHNLAAYARSAGVKGAHVPVARVVAERDGANKGAADASATLSRAEAGDDAALPGRVITATAPARQAALTEALRLSRGAEGAATPACESAVAVLGADDGASAAVRAAVTDEHLLQFAALLDEREALDALAAHGLPGPWAEAAALLGEGEDASASWEVVVREAKEGLRYTAEARPLRRGLCVYRTRAVVEGLTAAQVRAFHLDDAARRVWDENALLVQRGARGAARWRRGRRARAGLAVARRALVPAKSSAAASRGPWRRASTTTRARVWPRASDGGCYAINRRVELAGEEARVRGAVAVSEYVSCAAIRAAPPAPDGRPCAELVTLYYEDSAVRPSLVRMAVPRSLWGMVKQYEVALREYAAVRAAECGVEEEERGADDAAWSESEAEPSENAAALSSPMRKSISSAQLPADDEGEEALGGEVFVVERAPLGGDLGARRRASALAAWRAASTSLRSHSLGARRARARQGTWVKRIVIAAGIGVLHAALPGRVAVA